MIFLQLRKSDNQLFLTHEEHKLDLYLFLDFFQTICFRPPLNLEQIFLKESKQQISPGHPGTNKNWKLESFNSRSKKVMGWDDSIGKWPKAEQAHVNIVLA